MSPGAADKVSLHATLQKRQLRASRAIRDCCTFAFSFYPLRDFQLGGYRYFAMSDDEADPELLSLLAQSLGLGPKTLRPPKITVLEDAEFIYDSSTDVAIDMYGTKTAAATIWDLLQEKNFSNRDWSKHELHPKAKDESSVDFIFLMDLLNFSFWSDGEEAFAVDFRGKRWTGYWSLVACLQRALDEEIAITSPAFWVDKTKCTDDLLRQVFRSSTPVEMPLLEERIACIREAGYVLEQKYDGSFVNCVERASGSAAALVSLLVDNFPMFDDRHRFECRSVCFHKRAQILVADLWACFEGESWGFFPDIDQITMFAGEFIRVFLDLYMDEIDSFRLSNTPNPSYAWLHIL